MSNLDHERKSSSKSPINDSFRELHLSNCNRPYTAKKSEIDQSRTKTKIILRGNPSQNAKRVPTKERNTPLLSKLKPVKIPVDKERLYLDNMTLKVKINEQKSILLRYKAKISQLEKEIQKKEELSSSINPNSKNYLFKLLKQTIKNLRQEIEEKDSEIIKQRQNMKLSRFLELELELKAYTDECTRLKHNLEEIMKEKETNSNHLTKTCETDTKSLNLLKIIEENNKEIQKLKENLKLKQDPQNKPLKTPKIQEEFSKTSKELELLKRKFSLKEKKNLEEIEKLKDSLKEGQKEVDILKAKLDESNNLIQDLFKELKSLRQKKKSKFSPPKCLQIIFKILDSKKQSIKDFLFSLSSSHSDIIDSKSLFASLKKEDASFTENDLESIINYIKSETPSKISIKKLIDYYNTYDFSLLTESKEQKTSDLFHHLNLRMQLHRIPKENLIEALIGVSSSPSKQINCQEITLLLINSPFNFSKKQASLMTEFLFQGEKNLPYSLFVEKFYTSISDWQVFTANDEEIFDSFLLNLVGKHREYIEKFCLEFDKEGKETIKIDQFFNGMNVEEFPLSERMKEYLVVLFYSHNMELDSVPYRQFIQAYSSLDEPKEDSKTVMVQKYLELIASRLVGASKSVREAFAFDEGGIVVAEDFIGGMKRLGIEEIPKENLLVLLEALQYDPEQRIVCIDIDELEDVLESYGVPVLNNFDISGVFSEGENMAENFEGHVQKISLLDSGQIGCGETPDLGMRIS